MSLKVSPPIIFYLLLKLSNPEQIPNSVFVCFSILASKWGKSPQEKPSTNPVENKGGCNNSMYSSVPFILHLVQLVMGSNPEHSIYAFQDLDFWSNATICILVIHCVVSLNRILKIKPECMSTGDKLSHYTVFPFPCRQRIRKHNYKQRDSWQVWVSGPTRSHGIRQAIL